MKIDLLDEGIIKLLAQDGRASSKVLAKKCKVTPSTVRRRLNELIRKGMVRIVAVADRSGGVGAIEVFNNYFTTAEMIAAGWAIGLSTLDSYKNKKAVLQDERGMKRAKSLGRNIVTFLKSYQAPKAGFSAHGR